jgi:hypothetical protein
VLHRSLTLTKRAILEKKETETALPSKALVASADAFLAVSKPLRTGRLGHERLGEIVMER